MTKSKFAVDQWNVCMYFNVLAAFFFFLPIRWFKFVNNFEWGSGFRGWKSLANVLLSWFLEDSVLGVALLVGCLHSCMVTSMQFEVAQLCLGNPVGFYGFSAGLLLGTNEILMMV